MISEKTAQQIISIAKYHLDGDADRALLMFDQMSRVRGNAAFTTSVQLLVELMLAEKEQKSAKIEK